MKSLYFAAPFKTGIKRIPIMVVISILILIVAALLALVVLAQNPKGGGLAAGFTGASQIGGVQRTADFLEKSAWTLASSLMVLCLISASVQGTGSAEMDELDAPSEQVTTGDVAPEEVQPPAEEPPANATPAGQDPNQVPVQQVPAQNPTPATPQ